MNSFEERDGFQGLANLEVGISKKDLSPKATSELPNERA